MTGSRSRSLLALVALAFVSSTVLTPVRADATATIPTGTGSSYAGYTYGLGLKPTTFEATLDYFDDHIAGSDWHPLPGKLITFWVGGKLVCSATTALKVALPGSAGYGEAICSAKIGINAALKYHSFVAKFAGDDQYLPSSVTQALRWNPQL